MSNLDDPHASDFENHLMAILRLMGPKSYELIHEVACHHELLELARPEVDDLPGTDEDEDQSEYIAHIDGFEAKMNINANWWESADGKASKG